MTEKERELLLIVARICSEGLGQRGEAILKIVDSIKDEVYEKFGDQEND